MELNDFLNAGNFRSVLLWTLAGLLFLSFAGGIFELIKAIKKLF